jgi:hypothetical protein
MVIADLKAIYVSGDYIDVLGTTQWFLRHPSCPNDLKGDVAFRLKYARAAYQLFDGDTIAPISSDQEAKALEAALISTKGAGFGGVRVHLKNAAQELTAGNWAPSIRESIHAVEAAAKIIEPSAKTLEPALASLARDNKLHGGMKNGFAALYGFTSDEKGIRHSLLEKSQAEMDEADAQFMLGACAAFVSYLIARARQK